MRINESGAQYICPPDSSWSVSSSQEEEVVIQAIMDHTLPVFDKIFKHQMGSFVEKTENQSCFIKRMICPSELMQNVQPESRFLIEFSNLREHVYLTAEEESSPISRFFLGQRRSFSITIGLCVVTQRNKEEVSNAPREQTRKLLTLKRQFSFGKQIMHVYHHKVSQNNEELLGTISTRARFGKRFVEVRDYANQLLFILHGGCFTRKMNISPESNPEEIIGTIQKKKRDFNPMMNKNASSVGIDPLVIDFPIHSSSEDKALLFSSAFFINYVYFDIEE